MLDDEVAYIKSYSCAVDYCLNSESSSAELDIFIGTEIPDRLKNTNPKLWAQINLYRNLAKFLIVDSSNKELYKNYLDQYKTRKEPFNSPVIIIAGGASLMDKTKTETYRDYFGKMLQGFTGTIISGGTTAGIPGLVGEVKAELEKQSALDFSLIAYLPKELPANATKSIAYDSFYETDSDHFSVLEILSYWCDIVSSGIHPSDIILVGVEGGDIAAMEYRIALSLGAKVKILANSGRAASEFLEDKFRKTHKNLVKILPG